MRLPQFTQLSKEQDLINSLPLNGSFLVTGPPGTGKTVVALYRARMIQDQKHRALMISFSRVLTSYITSGSEKHSIILEAITYHKWIWNTYKGLYGLNPPRPQGDKNSFKFDWQKILIKMNTAPPEKGQLPFVIVDEGQDMPGMFYCVATYLGQYLTIFADENQRITEDQCTISDIKTFAGLDDSQQFELRKNYRNSKQIATLAACFYVGLPSGIAETPTRSSFPIVLKKHTMALQTALEIKMYFEQNPKSEIGVFLPTTALVKQYVSLLKQQLKDPSLVNFYYRESNQAKGDPAFDKPGINVLTYASAKGLEFDAVFIPELQAGNWTDVTEPSFKMKFYVLISRARDRIFFHYRGEKTPVVLYLEECLIQNGLLAK